MEQLAQFVSMSFAMRARQAADCCSSRDEAAWQSSDEGRVDLTRPTVLRQLTSSDNNNERILDKADNGENRDEKLSAFHSAAKLALPDVSSSVDEHLHRRRWERSDAVSRADNDAQADDQPLALLVGGSSSAAAAAAADDTDAVRDENLAADDLAERKHASSTVAEKDLEAGRTSDIDVETVVDEPSAAINIRKTLGVGCRADWFIANMLDRRFESSLPGW